jgi:hypothetical protein
VEVFSLGSQHVSIKNGARGNGGKHARYVAGDGRYADRDDVRLVEDGNLPSWAKDAEEFFAAADDHEREGGTKKMRAKDGTEYERSINGRAYKEVEAGIPREAKDPVQWAKDYARDLLGDQHPYRLAVHDKQASDGGRNVHMHLMFSTRTMDGNERSKEDFFKRAASAYRHPKTKELVQRDPASGGAPKSKYWNSRDSTEKTREKFERHVQRAAPDFKLTRSDAPEPKVGPAMKKAGKEYEAGRQERLSDVDELRKLKMVRGIVDKEIEKEQAREKEVEKPKSRSDDLWAQLEAKKGPQIEAQKQPAERPADMPKWHDFVAARKAEDKRKEAAPPPEPAPKERAAPPPADKEKVDWASRYGSMAGSRETSSSTEQPNQPKDDKAMSTNDLPTGPGYFPETKEERRQNEAEAPPLERLELDATERSQKEQGQEQERGKSRTNDLWERMEREQESKKDKDRDRDDSMDMDR